MQYLKPLSLARLTEDIDIVLPIYEALRARIIGYSDIKYLILKSVIAMQEKPKLKPVHISLVGAKSTGKTAIFKAVEESLPYGYVIYYDASMASRVGLLDHMYKYKEDDVLSRVKIICFDEIDKMSKQHQYGILNLLESGVMQETKFRRHREVDVRGKLFLGAGNELRLIYPPLASRFWNVEMHPYTEEQYFLIGMGLLFRMGFSYANSSLIVKAIDANIEDKTIRDIVKIGTLLSKNYNIQEQLVKLMDTARDRIEVD